MSYNKKEIMMKSEIPKNFKCPYCFRKIMANGVAFRSKTIYTKMDMDDWEEQEIESKKMYIEAEDELYEEFWALYPGSKPESTSENPTYEKHPVLSPFDTRYITNSNLPNGLKITFREDADGFIHEAIDTEGRSTNIRICPHCHNKLPIAFGKYPIKYISVVGITSSGKTILLSQLLTEIDIFLQNVNMTVEGLTREVDDFIRKYRIERGKKLPIGNATDILTMPLPINVKNNITGKKVTLVFYDIAGENCVKPEQMQKYGSFIPNADGIIMVTDPEQFPELVFVSDSDEEEWKEVYRPNQVAKAMYDAFVGSDFEGGVCDIPLAATISKSDLLRKCTHISAGENSNIFKDISYKDYNGKGLAYEDWVNIEAEVKMLLKQSSQGDLLIASLKNNFPNSSYFAVSALNNKPKVLTENGKKYYKMDVLPKTVRLEEPLYWILYKLGVIEVVHKQNETVHKQKAKPRLKFF